MSTLIKGKLDKYLFRERTYTYAVLDGASVPGLPQKLFESQTSNNCLYRGELSDELIHVAPYLVRLSPGSAFVESLFSECCGKHWCIFAQSEVSASSLQKHFRSLLTVNDESGNPLLFRFYDPRVLVPFLMTCAIEELNIIFGPVKYFFAESFDKSELCRMHVANGALVETKLGFNE
jgi:hypothetical protein